MSKWLKFKETTQPPAILVLDCLAKGMDKYFTKNHDGKTKIRNYGQFLHARWFGKKDLEDYRKMLERASSGNLLSWYAAYRKKKSELLKFALRLPKLNYKKLSNVEIAKLLSKLTELSAKAYHYAYDYVVLNTFYPEKINALILKRVKDVSILNKYLPYLAAVSQPTDTHKSMKALSEMVLYAKERGFDDMLKQKIKTYASRYGYLNMFTYFGQPLTEHDTEKSIRELSKKSKKEIIKETIAKFDQVFENAKKTNEFIKKSKLSQTEKKIILILKEYIYTSLWADELYHRVPYLARPLIFEIGRRTNLSYKQLIYMTADEIKDVLTGKAKKGLVDEVNQRIKDFAFVYENGKIRVFSGQTINKNFAHEIKEESKVARAKELQGAAVYPGKVRGLIQVIRTLDDIKKFKKGRVLVAASTAPTHVPAMTRASAIITDEGGLLSHAAIVSREMKKPCVIGTKIATKVLKDGMLVEVNANEGIVQIITKK